MYPKVDNSREFLHVGGWQFSADMKKFKYLGDATLPEGKDPGQMTGLMPVSGFRTLSILLAANFVI